MSHLAKLKQVNSHREKSRWAERICSELVYLDHLSELHNGELDSRIEEALDTLLARIAEDGAITAKTVAEIEGMLADLSPIAKSITQIYVAHAHIDMNWQWGYNETAAITLDTFRTMLDLMREYPDFTFAQSQASTYEIVEKYCPEMLEEIKARVHEGRWEVTAAEWVEPDKNMPSGESLTRQILQAKKYLSRLLDIPADSLDMDFVPDTFGHAVTIPEVLANAGVRYMYHCRGHEGPALYRYTAPSGKSILCFYETTWYNKNIGPHCFEYAPVFCHQENQNISLCVYGVGDHGGGPTRLDIEKILEYRSWPLTPNIRFGTYHEFFKAAEESGVEFPTADTERNFVFTGCYTTQSRIKMSNRIAEARAYEAEELAVSASLLADRPIAQERFDEPWRNILFGHFHDILPGSGTIETREYALGKFQDTLTTLQTNASSAMRAIATAIDTSSIAFDGNPATRSEGAGVGYGAGAAQLFSLPSAERGRGLVRVLHVFNPTAYERDEMTEVVVWDYASEAESTAITDAEGNELFFTLAAEMGKNQNPIYWGHSYKKYLVKVKVAPFGYTTLIIKPKEQEGRMPLPTRNLERTDHTYIHDKPVVLENDKLFAVFDKKTAHLVELRDKQTGERLITEKSCFFRYTEENPRYRMTSWRVGPYMKTADLNDTCTVKITEITENPAFCRMAYTFKHDENTVTAVVTLRSGSDMLDFDVTIDFEKTGVRDVMIPQISFVVPVSYKTKGKALCEIPYGTLERDALAFDVPSHGSIGVLGESKHIVALLADTKYGFRHYGNEAQVTLVRGAYDPDPYSDRGIHHIRLGVTACEPDGIDRRASALMHPLPYVSGECHTGTLPLCGAPFEIRSDARVSAVKGAEDGDGIVLRLYDPSGNANEATLAFQKPIRTATLTDSNENPLTPLATSGNAVSLAIPTRAVVSVKITF